MIPFYICVLSNLFCEMFNALRILNAITWHVMFDVIRFADINGLSIIIHVC